MPSVQTLKKQQLSSNLSPTGNTVQRTISEAYRRDSVHSLKQAVLDLSLMLTGDTLHINFRLRLTSWRLHTTFRLLSFRRRSLKSTLFSVLKNPHPQTFLVGGMSIPIDPNSQNAINADKIAMMLEYNKLAKEFVEKKVYVPDVLTVAPFYLDWAGIGAGHRNYMSYGEFPETQKGYPNDMWLPSGIIKGGDLSNIMGVDQSKIAEDCAHAWYEDKSARHPFDGASDKKIHRSTASV